MKGQPTKTGGGNGPKWKGQTWSSVGPSYERKTAVVRKKAAPAKKAATAPKRGSKRAK